jgi:hypothetical protein
LSLSRSLRTRQSFLNYTMNFYWSFSSHVTPLNGTRIALTSSVCIVEGNGQVNYDFLTIGLKGAQMLPLTQKQIILNVYSNDT